MAKVPLENPSQERAVLGALLANTTTFWMMKDRARESLFTVPIHQKIVGIAHQIAESGRELSAPAIIARLSREDNSDFSPEGYLATLIADEAEPENLADFLTDLEDMWARRSMARLGTELIRQSTEDSGLDAMGRLEAAKEKMEALNDPISASVRHIRDIASELLATVSEAAMAEQVVGLDLGIKGLQDLTGPLMPGRLYILAGPSGSGKSAAAYQVAEFVSRKETVLFEEIEMEGEELVERDLAARTGIAADKIERASLSNDEVDALFTASAAFDKLKLYINSTTSPTVAQIRARAMRMKRLKGLGLLVIDHLLYLKSPDRKLGEFEAIRQNLQALKKMAKDLGIPIVLLSQLKAGFNDGPWKQIARPNINNLYGGSSVEQEADVICFVHREEYQLRKKEPTENAPDRGEWMARLDQVEGKAEFVLAKRRGGKGFGIRTVYFEGERVRFTDERPKSKYAETKGQGQFNDVTEVW